MKQLLLVGFGGFAGSVLRFFVSKLNTHWHFLSIPFGTLTVNVLGSLLIGILAGLSLKNDGLSESMKLLLITGFCGGFTTFSAFSHENLLLINNGQIFHVLLYSVGSIALGFTAVFVGYGIVK